MAVWPAALASPAAPLNRQPVMEHHIAMHVRPAHRASASRLALAAGSVLVAGAVAGCAPKGGAAAGASPTPNAYEAGVRFAQCMRDHGIQMPDPQVSGNGKGFGFRVQVTPGADGGVVKPDPQKLDAAQSACRKYLPNGGTLSPAQQAQAQQNALKFARCMRSHGIDFPDPQTSSGGVMIGGPRSSGINPDDPKFQAAQKACQSLLGDAKSGGFGPVTIQGGGGGSGSGSGGGFGVAGG